MNMRHQMAICIVGLAVFLTSACGGDGGQSGRLVWQEPPERFRPPNLPRDHILRGTVKNDSLDRVDLTAKDVRVIDARGMQLQGSAIFLSNFLRTFYPTNRYPASELPEEEKLRLGRKVRIEPGKTAPLTVSWRQTRAGRAVRLTYPGGTLPIPSGSPNTSTTAAER